MANAICRPRFTERPDDQLSLMAEIAVDAARKALDAAGRTGDQIDAVLCSAANMQRAYPAWTPTENIRRRYAAQGKTLPAVWPAGPDNPMGLHALYIGNLYAIHGTNATFGIGLRVSSGCVRLRADDIKYLFDNVPVGTRVQFVNQPVKTTVEPDGGRYMEVHEPLSRTEEEFNSTASVPLPMNMVSMPM